MAFKETIVATKTVTIGYDPNSGKLTASPALAFVASRQPLTFRVVVPAGHSIEIDFGVTGSKKGPFPRDTSDPRNPVRGRWMTASTANLPTRPADASGAFEYSLVVRNTKGNDVAALDPMVVVKN